MTQPALQRLLVPFGLLVLLGVLACGSRSSSAGPLVLTDDAGNRLALAGPAARIVSLIPASTELLFALGAGPRLVGRTTWCDYPPEASRVPSMGDGISPNVEAVLAARPDLVVLYRSGSNRAAGERLRVLGIPVLELALDRIADFERATELLGRATGRDPEARALVRRVRSALDSASVRAERPPLVFLLAWDQPPMTLGAGSFLSEVLERAGGRNAFGDLTTSSAPISIEAVAARNPDFILVAEREPAIVSRPEWRVVPAVRERRFLQVSGSEFSRPSPRLPDAVRRLARVLAGAEARR